MDANVMGWLAWLIVGALSGWLASIVMKTNAEQGLLLDIVVGLPLLAQLSCLACYGCSLAAARLSKPEQPHTDSRENRALPGFLFLHFGKLHC